MITKTILVNLISMMISVLGMMVDGLVIGRMLGQNSVAAYGFANPMFVVFAAIGGIFGAANISICGFYSSKGQLKESCEFLSMSFILEMIIGILMIAGFIIFIGPLCLMLGANPAELEVYNLTRDYLLWLIPGIPFILLGCSFSSLLQIDGKAKLSLIGAVLMTTANVIGDIMTAILHMEMAGMAMATSFSYLVMCIVIMPHYFNKSSMNHFIWSNIKWSQAPELFKVGLPTALIRLANTLRQIVSNRMILLVATTSVVSAFTVQQTVNTLVICLTQAIAMSTLTITGVLYGEDDKQAIEYMITKTIKIALILNGVLTFLLFFFSGNIASCFITGEKEVVELSGECVMIMALSLCPQAVSMIYMYYLQAIGRKFETYFICIMENFVLIVLIQILFINSVGAQIVWLSIPLGKIAMLIIIFIMAWIIAKHLPLKIKDYLHTDDVIELSDEAYKCISVDSAENVDSLSAQISDFSEANKLEQTVEKQLGNAILTFVKKWYEAEINNSIVLDLRIFAYHDRCVIRFRDNSKENKIYKNLEIEGLECKYINTMGFNSLLIEVKR